MPPSEYTVLLVDDEETVLALLKKQLARLPYVLITTTDPAEAIRLLATREIAVLVCDLNMPGVDGNTVLQHARRENADLVSIVLTGGADPAATIRAINDGGIWKYIAKPWKREELIQIIDEGVARYSAAQRQRQLAHIAADLSANQTTPANSAPEPGSVQRDFLEALSTEMASAVFSAPAGEANNLIVRALRKLKVRRSGTHAGDKELTGGRYQLVEVLGEGGMGTVFKANDQLLGMPVAIKILGAHFTSAPAAVEALKAEARIAMQLSHKHIVRIHNLQKAGEHFFLVMEYVPGRSFLDILHRYGKLPIHTVVQTVMVCADALAYAHRHDVLHRDLKPNNLMLAENGVLKLIDFGVACLMSSDHNGGEVVGTPIYMSPEQLRGEPLDHRTDIYALGIIAYQMLTGLNPKHATLTARQALADGPPAIVGLPDELAQVLRRAIAPHREERWPAVQQFATALAEAGEKIKA